MVLGVAGACAATSSAIAPYRVEADAIPERLAPSGDAARGREVITGRDGNCLLCHAVPAAGKRQMGDLGPALAGVGSRLSAGQIRLRIVDAMRLNPDTIMPSYYRVDGLNQVAEAWRGKPVLTAQQIEDAIAYLQTLR
ncbi:MAG: putative cytochrome c, putative soxX protein [Burkholderiales bacterium]|jgi:sulfur-oxidizing protein SoxX|nr:putative cytochrome c, putative soxX protein [Burkholderiales bacterium]